LFGNKHEKWVSLGRINLNRRVNAVAYMEIFFVAAVTSVLAIRLFLALTGYPQIGGGGLHIAHMLWGGLLMLGSLIILLCFIGQTSERLATLIGGIGFGTFIDETGKFITSDSNYFFQPAISIIYILFVALFVFMRALESRQHFTEQEYVLNALRVIEEVVVRDLDEDERRKAEDYLRAGGSASYLHVALQKVLSHAVTVTPKSPGLIERAKSFVADIYRSAARQWWFSFGVIAFFLGQLGIQLLYAFILVFIIGLGWNEIFDFRLINRIIVNFLHLTFVDWIEIGFSLLSGAFVMWGIVCMRRSRLKAFAWFERSILISILITQVFAFYKEQFSALLGLFLNIAVLFAVRFGIEQERAAKAKLSKAVVPPV